MSHGFMSILIQGVRIIISMDELEEGFFLFSHVTISEAGFFLLFKLMLLRRADVNQIHAYVRARVRARVLSGILISFSFFSFLPLKPSLFFLGNIKVLV